MLHLTGPLPCMYSLWICMYLFFCIIYSKYSHIVFPYTLALMADGSHQTCNVNFRYNLGLNVSLFTCLSNIASSCKWDIQVDQPSCILLYMNYWLLWLSHEFFSVYLMRLLVPCISSPWINPLCIIRVDPVHTRLNVLVTLGPLCFSESAQTSFRTSAQVSKAVTSMHIWTFHPHCACKKRVAIKWQQAVW